MPNKVYVVGVGMTCSEQPGGRVARVMTAQR